MTYCCQHFFAILEASTEKRGILMNWNETYGPGSQPDSEAISRYVGCQAPPYNGGRWLMIEVTDPAILQDVKTLIAVRMDTKKK